MKSIVKRFVKEEGNTPSIPSVNRGEVEVRWVTQGKFMKGLPLFILIIIQSFFITANALDRPDTTFKVFLPI
jgi:hypothetical protein